MTYLQNEIARAVDTELSTASARTALQQGNAYHRYVLALDIASAVLHTLSDDGSTWESTDLENLGCDLEDRAQELTEEES